MLVLPSLPGITVRRLKRYERLFTLRLLWRQRNRTGFSLNLSALPTISQFMEETVEARKALGCLPDLKRVTPTEARAKLLRSLIVESKSHVNDPSNQALSEAGANFVRFMLYQD
jgi:hypothetical protein